MILTKHSLAFTELDDDKSFNYTIFWTCEQLSDCSPLFPEASNRSKEHTITSSCVAGRADLFLKRGTVCSATLISP